ncbi:DUF4138 domain-containing protein [Salegentibacter flavus]|uniref:Bacteroides conjugative transposon TraN protein n=1 Tax=Salegentibacter flavus TaxID=287099 RepID=A0A1I5CSL9_9FLAO|nr:DUF4138 domain-containing protein [Salegentibacter flavus]SFN89917.1 protein of unknown function [Salegentibacter flavus]
MKTLLALWAFFLTTNMNAQEYPKLFGNNSENVAVVFPEPIRQAIVGNDNFAFGYSPEKPQRVGLLKAQPGMDSNLIVITTDNRLYTFHLKYANSLQAWNYFIEANSGKTLKAKDTIIKKEVKVKFKDPKFEYMATHLLKPEYKTLQSRTSNDIRLGINKVLYYSDYLILILELENKSGIIFEPGKLRLFSELGNKRKKASYQKVTLDPLYISKVDKTVLSGQKERFAVILPKYIPGNSERISVQIQEKTTSRNVRLKIRRALFK